MNRLTHLFRGVSFHCLGFLLFLSLFIPGSAESSKVYPGIDVLLLDDFDLLAGKAVGLLTNQTGICREGRTTIDLMSKTGKFRLTALFAPEHGIQGTEDGEVRFGVHEKTGLPVHSLYGTTRKPTKEMLHGLDVLVFDIQDIGTRFYTYIGAMSKAMEAAKENDVAFVVLDRPNPIGGVRVEGAVADPSLCGPITCIHPIPTRHGMTVGELALLFNDHFGIGCELEVVTMKGWKRELYFDETGLPWINPSPNMKTLNGAILYPGVGIVEATTLSCARGTARPFEMYGAPYLDGGGVAADLLERRIKGAMFAERSFVPSAPGHKFFGERCSGIEIGIESRESFDPILTGLHLIRSIHQKHPMEYRPLGNFATLCGDDSTWTKLTREGIDPERIIEEWRVEVKNFLKVREKYLLY